MSQTAVFDLYDIEQDVIQLLTSLDQLVYKVRHCHELEQQQTIQQIAESMQILHQLQQQIYRLQPALIPPHLKDADWL